MMAKRGCLLWVDHLHLASLLWLVVLRIKSKIEEVRYLSAGSWVRRLAETLPARLFSVRPAVLLYREADRGRDLVEMMRDPAQDSRSRAFWAHFSKRARELLSPLAGRYDRGKIMAFFEQELADDLEIPVKLADLAVASRMGDPSRTEDDLVLLRGNILMTSIRSFYGGKPLRFVTYPDIKQGLMLLYFPFKLFGEIVLNGLLILAGKELKKPSELAGPVLSGRQSRLDRAGAGELAGPVLSGRQSRLDRAGTGELAGPRIAVLYAHGADLQRKSDYFWLPESGIARERVLLYFKHHTHPPRPEIIGQVESLDIPWVNLLPKRLDLRPLLAGSMEFDCFPTRDYVGRLVKTLQDGLTSFASWWVAGDALKRWLWVRLTELLGDTALFESFFAFYDVKLHYSVYEMGRHMVAANLAMDIQGGVDLSHLWSNLDYTERRLGKPHDVYFTWGPFYKRHFFDRVFFRVRHYVYTGYVYDFCFAQAREKAKAYRRRLEDHGARFVISLFDQSLSSGESLWNHAQEDLYRRLLGEVLARPDFGLIAKPKKASGREGLIRKFPGLTSLVDKSLSTGRFLILNGSDSPSEAAQASDLAVGVGAASTPSLEAALAGVPSVTYNIEGWTAQPIYERGHGRILFTDLDEMLQAIQSFRLGERADGFGDYSFVMPEIDPFRDGAARFRVGRYLKNLLDQFERGRAKEEALEYANTRYREAFGEDKVVSSGRVPAELAAVKP